MPSNRPRIQFLYHFGKLLDFCEAKQIEIIVFTFYRSPDQQEQEYIKGKSKIRSNGPHQKWLAVDIAIMEDGITLFDKSIATRNKYKVLGDYWKSLASTCIWGGDFQSLDDIYHFELRINKKK